MTNTVSLFGGIERFVVCNTAEAMERLQDRDSDIVILRDESLEEIEPDLIVVVPTLQNYEQRTSLSTMKSRSVIANTLGEIGLANEQLESLMVRHLELFARMFDQKDIEVRIELTDRQSCPKFHCDNVFVRMLVTYHGPTTEFIDRRDPETIFKAPVASVVFLKGHKDTTYQDRILHRSPEFTNGVKRLTMILNFCDWMGKR